MSDEIETVSRGDVISAQFMNRIVKHVNATNEKLAGIDDLLPGPGKVQVPDVFGLALKTAKAEITKPTYGLLIGNIFDTGGNEIFPGNTEALELPVLNQIPDAGKIVKTGSAVNLVIAHVPSSGNGGAEHSVTGMDPADGAAAGDRVTVIGEKFDDPYYRNTVFFDGRYETSPLAGSGPLPDGSGKIGLVVDIPDNLPNLPRDVQVGVRAFGVTRFLPDLYPVSEEGSTPPLKIEGWEPSQPYYREGAAITIIGTGFSDTPADNKITFIYGPNTEKTHTVPGESKVDYPNGLIGIGVTIPDFPVGMRPATNGTLYNVELHIGDDTAHKAKGMTIQIRPPLT